MDNKYYTAKILLQTGSFDETGKVNAKFDNYEAVVIIFDCIKKLDVSLRWCEILYDQLQYM